MKLGGLLTLVAGFIVFAGLAAIPTSVTVLDDSASCGPPALRVLVTEADPSSGLRVQRIEQKIIDACVSQSWERLVVGIVVGGITAIAGLLLLVVTPAPRHRPAGRATSGSASSSPPDPPSAPHRTQAPWGDRPPRM